MPCVLKVRNRLGNEGSRFDEIVESAIGKKRESQIIDAFKQGKRPMPGMHCFLSLAESVNAWVSLNDGANT
jgi:hypothetical protein